MSNGTWKNNMAISMVDLYINVVGDSQDCSYYLGVDISTGIWLIVRQGY